MWGSDGGRCGRVSSLKPGHEPPSPLHGVVCLFLTLALPGQVAKPTRVTLLWVSANNPPGILLELVAGTFARDMCVTHTDIRVPVRLR